MEFSPIEVEKDEGKTDLGEGHRNLVLNIWIQLEYLFDIQAGKLSSS